MPMKKENYNKSWPETSKRIRFERAGNRCEFCGVPNRVEIVRSDLDPARYIIYDEAEMMYTTSEGDPIRFSEVPSEFDISRGHVRVTLTVAHLNHDTRDDRDENLKALCNRCHLRYDAQHHANNAAKTRRRKKREALESLGQTSMFTEAIE